MNVAVGVARSKHLAATDGTDMLVSRVGPDPVAQAQDRHHVDANAHCANSFENRSSPLDFENRWRWPVSYRSIEVLAVIIRSEEHTSELQSLRHLVCRLLLEKKK